MVEAREKRIRREKMAIRESDKNGRGVDEKRGRKGGRKREDKYNVP
jgi:hypothetical protein